MRDIKFRGKDYKNKWRIGDLVQEKWGKGKAIMIKKDKIAWSVLEETVCEYTGLKDKNGVEIYEGDILQNVYDDDVGIIEWSEEDAMFVLIIDDLETNFSNERSTHWKIIGNIYDNPDLLKGE